MAQPSVPKYQHVKHCSTHPKFLHSNSTSHRWAFGAVAELIDNSMDPDVNASQFCIDMKEFNGEPSLVFMDNGCGLTPERLHKMLSFGHSKKQLTPGDKSIGKHGNGFKSGTMRLGKDVLVLTKCSSSMSAGFLSQTFLADTGAEDVLIPQISWDLRGNRLDCEDNDAEESLQAICNYSIFPDEASLLSQLDAIPGTGAILIISNLRRHEGVLELDFKTDPHDIRITTAITNSHYQQLRPNQPTSTDVPIDYSLRAYVAILYKVPRMQIFIRDKKVKTKRITGILNQKETETYRPMGIFESIRIELGFNTENKNLYGMMLYHRNRLIKPYMRVGIQLEENEKGMGVLGIVEADFLQPTHNKQDFDDTTAYRRLLKKLSDVLAEYWWEKKERITSLPHVETRSKPVTQTDTEDVPDVVWVQCDDPSCLKWRVLPDGTDPASLPDVWYCTYHPSPRYRRHEEPEQEWDASIPHEIIERRKERKREYDREKKEREAQRKRQRLEAMSKDEQLSVQKQKEAAMKELEDQRSKEKIVQEEERKHHEDEVKRLQEEYTRMQAMRDEIMKENDDLLKQLEKTRGENRIQEALATMDNEKEIFSTQVSESDQFPQQEEEELNSAEFIQDKDQVGPEQVNDMSHIFTNISEVPDANSMLAEEQIYHPDANHRESEEVPPEIGPLRSSQHVNHQQVERDSRSSFPPVSADHFLQLSSGNFGNERTNPSYTENAQLSQDGALQRTGDFQTSTASIMTNKDLISHVGHSSRVERSMVTSAPNFTAVSTVGHNVPQLSVIPTHSLERTYHPHREGFGWSQEQDIASTTSRHKIVEAQARSVSAMPRSVPTVIAALMPETPSPSCMPTFTSSFSPVAVDSQTTSLTSSSFTPALTQQFLVEANASLNRGPNPLTLQDYQDAHLPASGTNVFFDQRPVISLRDRSESEQRQSTQFQAHSSSTRSDIQERFANTDAALSGRLADSHHSNLSLGPRMLSAQLPLEHVLTNHNSGSEAEAHIDKKAIFSFQRRLKIALQTLLEIGGSEAHAIDLDNLPSSDLDVLTICDKTRSLVAMRWQSYEQEIQKLKADLAYAMTEKLQNGQSFRINGLTDNWGVGVGLSK